MIKGFFMKNRSKFLPALALSLVTGIIASLANAQAVSDQIIIKYKGSSQQLKAAQRLEGATIAASQHGVLLSHKREMSGKATVVSLNKKLSKMELKQLLKSIANSDPSIEYVEEDVILQTNLVPNDSRYNEQWSYFSSTGGINMPAAWDMSTGAGVNVAVVDTGYRPHVDLVNNILPGYDFISTTTVSQDGDGRDSNAQDPGDGCNGKSSSWHGTHVAGTIAAQTNNSIGVAGVAYNARIVPVRVLGCGGGYTSDIADGVVWASGDSVPGVPVNNNPVSVINMSLGGISACGSTMQNSINAALNRNAVVVVSAGNNNADAANTMPANCAGVVTVAAVDKTGGKAYYSNYGTTVEVAAPGGDTSSGASNGILSTLNSGVTTPGSDSYAFYQGTSMAAPHVSGVVALMKAIQPRLTPAQVIKILQTSSRAFPAACSGCGAGIVNAAAAVNSANTALIPLYDYWSSAVTDHIYTIDRGDAGLAYYSYGYSGIVGYLSSTPRSGFIPLYRYNNVTVHDHIYTTVRNDAGLAYYGYDFERIEAYVMSTSASGFVPLNRYNNTTIWDHIYSPVRNDGGYGYYGYVFEGIEGYVKSDF